MCVVDRRERQKLADDAGGEAGDLDVPHDHGGWLSHRRGNRVRRMVSSGAEESFGAEMLRRIFGL